MTKRHDGNNELIVSPCGHRFFDDFIIERRVSFDVDTLCVWRFQLEIQSKTSSVLLFLDQFGERERSSWTNDSINCHTSSFYYDQVTCFLREKISYLIRAQVISKRNTHDKLRRKKKKKKREREPDGEHDVRESSICRASTSLRIKPNDVQSWCFSFWRMREDASCVHHLARFAFSARHLIEYLFLF